MSWDPDPNWSEFYSTAPEIQRYYARLVEKHGLDKYIRLEHRVTSARWSEETSKWFISVVGANGKEFVDECDIFINASGVLNNFKWPKIPTLHKFKGDLVHTARWPDHLEYKGKKVAVLGSGSSGIQVSPDKHWVVPWIQKFEAPPKRLRTHVTSLRSWRRCSRM